jgi:hypothetical protein
VPQSASSFLGAFGVSDELSHLTHSFLRCFLLPLWPEHLLSFVQLYLASQGVDEPMQKGGILALPALVILDALLIYSFDWGWVGAPVASAIVLCLQLGLAASYVAPTQRSWRASWRVFDPEALYEVLRLSAPAALTNFTLMWEEHVPVLIAANLGDVYLAAHTCVAFIRQLLLLLPADSVADVLFHRVRLARPCPPHLRPLLPLLTFRCAPRRAAGIVPLLLIASNGLHRSGQSPPPDGRRPRRARRGDGPRDGRRRARRRARPHARAPAANALRCVATRCAALERAA